MARPSKFFPVSNCRVASLGYRADSKARPGSAEAGSLLLIVDQAERAASARQARSPPTGLSDDAPHSAGQRSSAARFSSGAVLS